MTRGWAGRTWVALGMLLAASGHAAADRNDDACYGGDSTDDQTVAGCNAVLGRPRKSGRSDQASAYFNRGLAYKNKGDDDRALADFEAAIRLDAGDARYYRNRGAVRYEKEAYDLALEDFNESIRRDPEYGLPYDDRADLYADVRGDYDRAIEDYGAFLRIDPNRAATYYKRSLALEKTGDFSRALADLEQAASRDAADADIRKALARVRARLAATRASAPATLADLEAQERATAEMWARLPFSARRALFVTRKAEVFGGYQARPTSIFAPGEKLLSYVEPAGYTWTSLEDGTYRFGVSVDWELLTRDGKVLGGQKKLLAQEFTTHVRNREFFLSIAMSFDGLEAGDYVLAYTLHDGGSDRVTRVEQPLTIAP